MESFSTYSFPEAKSIVVCGDIHGEFNAVIYKLCYQYQMTDTVLVIAGDCGFGFDKPGYYDNVYNRNSSRLSKANNWVVMFRGNHDDRVFSRGRVHHSDSAAFRIQCYQACGITFYARRCRQHRPQITGRSMIPGIRALVSHRLDDEMPVMAGKLDSISKNSRSTRSSLTRLLPFLRVDSQDGLTEWATLDPDIPPTRQRA